MNQAPESTPGDGLTLEQLRAQLLQLTSLAATAELPKPSVINDAFHPMPGPEWQVNHPCEVGKSNHFRRYGVRVVNHDEAANIVYLHTPGHMPDDYTAATTTEVRQFAMALLAACNESEARSAGLVRLDERRRSA
ncbi:hypothetical protein STENM36S_08723 [Streptomyces tendae]